MKTNDHGPLDEDAIANGTPDIVDIDDELDALGPDYFDAVNEIEKEAEEKGDCDWLDDVAIDEL